MSQAAFLFDKSMWKRYILTQVATYPTSEPDSLRELGCVKRDE